MPSSSRPTLAFTGLSGFVGSLVARRLADRFALLDLYHRTPAAHDVVAESIQLRADNVGAVVDGASERGASALINVAAAADVDACEREAGDRSGTAYQANVLLPAALAAACAGRGLRFLHVSTDYVFDGERGPYREDDQLTQPANWYGQTKLEGERAVRQANPVAVIVRPALPYGEDSPRKGDLVRLVRSRLEAGQPFDGAADAFISPTWIGDIAEALAGLATTGGGGVYHLAGITMLSPYEAALIVARTFGLDERLVRPATLAAISATGRAPRPRNSALLSARLPQTLSGGFRLKGFAEGVGLLRAAAAAGAG